MFGKWHVTNRITDFGVRMHALVSLGIELDMDNAWWIAFIVVSILRSKPALNEQFAWLTLKCTSDDLHFQLFVYTSGSSFQEARQFTCCIFNMREGNGVSQFT